MGIKFTNNAFSTLNGSITDVATTINLAAGTGALFPTLGAGDYFYATLYSGATREIVKVTARSTDALTVVRGQEGTTNIAWASGSTIGHRVTAATLNVLASKGIVTSTRTSNTILGTDDLGKLINVTSGTFTQTLAAAATLGNGWWCYYYNSGAGFITLDPNASENIVREGVSMATWVLWPGEMCLLQSDGVSIYYTNIKKGRITQTISGTVASVSFATGLTYRGNLMLHVEGLTSSTGGSNVSVYVNSAAANRGGYLRAVGATVSGDSPTLYLDAFAGVLADAGSLNGVHARIALKAGAAYIFAEATCAHRNNASVDVRSVSSGVWNSINKETITSISVVGSSSTLTGGTIVLEEM